MEEQHRVEPATAPVPPQNPEAEQSVLGAMMIAPAAIDNVSDILQPSDFYLERHGRIYRAALDLHAAGEPVDALTVTAELRTRGQLDGVGGQPYVYGLANLVPATANVGHYATLVRNESRRRQYIRVGAELARIGYDGGVDPDELHEKALEVTREFDQHRDHTTLQLETWAQFERSATETVPTLVDGLWPAGGLGFIAAPPKKGKTWVGLDLAIAVAAGVPFLNQFPVTEPQPVVYVALEGHRAAIRGRIGILARGHGLDPDLGSGDLRNLHVLYKPRGLNLSDPAWVRQIRDTVQAVGAKLVLVDVLRRAATLKENSNDEWAELLLKLQPLQENDCSIALLHHFGKLTELSKERSPGERMSGAGAMYGAFDVGVFITGSDEGARKLRVEFETRDLASPDPIGVHLTGEPSGAHGFVYRDTATWEIEEAPDEADVSANAAELTTWLEKQPGRQATTAEIIYGLPTSDRTILRRRQSWLAAGVIWTPAKGKNPALYSLPSDPPPGSPRQPATETMAAQETLDLQEEAAFLDPPRHDPPRTNGDLAKTLDLQADSWVASPDSPTERNATADAAFLTEDAWLEEQAELQVARSEQ